MNRSILLSYFIILSLPIMAQFSKEQGAIKKLCGCFEVQFMYAETFAPDTAYALHKPYKASGLEWVEAEETSDKKFVFQHLLLVNDTTIIKHWREDWEYNRNDWWVFDHDAAWKHVIRPGNVKGEWTQTVWEVDDAPRYQGSGRWVFNDNKYYWENTADAPLPRREYTHRSDYNVLQRGNRIIITDTGWVHEQENKKIIRADGAADKLLAQEKGFNIYHRTDASKCAKAAAWWAGHRQFWNTVRSSWAEVMKNKDSIHLLKKAEGQFLYEHLAALEQDPSKTGTKLKEKTTETLQKFVRSKDAGSTAAAKTF
jgi:hypothetical protein